MRETGINPFAVLLVKANGIPKIKALQVRKPEKCILQTMT